MPPSSSSYDIVVLDHILQQGRSRQVQKIIALYRDALIEGGEMIVIVPSLEWATTQYAVHDAPPTMAYLSIYGTDDQPHLCGMTIATIRLILMETGFRVTAATTESYIAILEGEKVEAMQNVVTGRKVTPDPATAIG
jgi:predicted SAM-dependent methyltransferase